MNAREVLQEFVDACEAYFAGPKDTATWLDDKWRELQTTYAHAKDVLAHEGQEEQE